jgi:glutamate-1-semialdehyde 2,1-aminomutase
MASLNSPDEVELAELLLEIHPWADMVRYARGGGEAMAVAVRIARASTGRSIVAFCGYHGWHDWYLAANHARAGSEDPLAGHLLSGLKPAGVPLELAGTTLPFEFNRAHQLESIVREYGDQLAAIVLEPTRSYEPAPGFLEEVRGLATQCGAVLVFDEISVGWRLCLGGAHLRYRVAPDVAVFSKALANGYPMAAVVGTRPVMEAAQQTFISSTMWTDGIGPAAALAAIRKLQRCDVPEHVASIGARYRKGLCEIAAAHRVPVAIRGHDALSVLTFEHDQAAELQTLFTVRMLAEGFLAGAAFYPSFAHEEDHVDAYLSAATRAFAELGSAIQQHDIAARLQGDVKHSGFRRLA